MAIIVKPFTFFPGTVIRSSEVNSDFDTIYTDYNGNITNLNIAAGAGIEHSKLQTVGSAQILVGSGAGVLTPRTMSGDATISNTGVVTVSGGSGSTFNNTTLTGNSTVNGPATFNSTVTFSTMTPGSILFAGLGGLLSQDNANFFWDDTNNRLGIGTTAPQRQIHIRSTGSVGVTLEADTDNIDESHVPFVKFIQDGGIVNGFVGYIGVDNTDPEGAAFTGTLGNNLFLGSKFGGVQIGATNTVVAEFNTGAGEILPFDFTLGSGDQVSRGNSGSSRALVKDFGNVLVINYAGDFSNGLRVDGPGLSTGGIITSTSTDDAPPNSTSAQFCRKSGVWAHANVNAGLGINDDFNVSGVAGAFGDYTVTFNVAGDNVGTATATPDTVIGSTVASAIVFNQNTGTCRVGILDDGGVGIGSGFSFHRIGA